MNDVRTMSNGFSELCTDELLELNGGSWNSWKWYDTAISVAVPAYGVAHFVHEDKSACYTQGFVNGYKDAKSVKSL